MIGRESKSVTKCIRMTPSVESYIDQQPGENFTDKFANLIEEVRSGEADRLARISRCEAKLAKYREDLDRCEEVLEAIDKIQSCLNWVEKSVSQIVIVTKDVIQDTKPPPGAAEKL